jgi:hypothetical protein
MNSQEHKILCLAIYIIISKRLVFLYTLLSYSIPGVPKKLTPLFLVFQISHKPIVGI